MMHQYHGHKLAENHQHGVNLQGDYHYLQHNHHRETVIKGEIDSRQRNNGGTDSCGSPVWSNLGACLAPFGFLLFGAGITVVVIQDGVGYTTGIPLVVLGVLLFFAGLLVASSCIRRREANNVSEHIF